MGSLTYPELIKRTVTRIPHNLQVSDALLSAGGVGLTSAALAAAYQLLYKKKKDRNWLIPLYFGLGGAGLGLAGSAAWQNVKENLNIEYDQPIKDVIKEVFPRIDYKNPNKTYTLYFEGMDMASNDLSNREVVDTDKDSAVSIPAGYARYMGEWAKQLPEQAKLNIVGFSAGGRSVLQHLDKIKRPVENYLSVDPLVSQFHRVSKIKPGENIKNFKVLGGYALADPTSPGNKAMKWFTKLGIVRQAIHNVPEQYRLYNGYDHSMRSSKFRPSPGKLAEMTEDLHRLSEAPDDFYSYYRERIV